MANGLEDLREKNKSATKKNFLDYSKWKNLQGREDAEMLQEKSSGWKAELNNRGDYEYDEE